ncbi:MAG: asparagine synthase (glutamine-hydrolyzing) [Prochlorococcus marinus CUG1431]|uniref:asparagine synthase (glutamine-hydrolyzing) n=1 Tax=Prochlorococcus marinus CUG1433 TaxID=2774506 RepID=A0A9D9BS93_PROMR|nr:asparagine synthase (glutamine-hydrolyzing) [Prochlorococcus marinus CUG1433]MBO6981204.1 asparagine synthase (glutamine-hydrolyzing) [Prochlorococcus marinus CUG1431]
MCGIFGYFLKTPNEYRSQEYVSRFKLDLYNRGPDSFHYKSREGCVIGISRLSIVDISHETQPFSIDEINITVVFNGEIYNYKSLRDHLSSKGIKLLGYSEIEVIANLYKLYSEKFINFLDGMFAIAILDHKKQSFIIFRDPYGIKPIYWTLNNGDFAFSSDLTPLISCFTENKLNTNAIHEYLFHGYCSSNTCIASNIHKVPPSSYLKFEKNRVITGKYNSFTQNKYIDDFEVSVDNIDFLLKESISEQIAEEVPMGVMLSGGIDSSLLAKYLSLDKKLPKKIKSYSVRFLDKKLSNDFSYAERLAKELKLDHETITINSIQALEILQNTAYSLDEPIADSGIIGTNIICQKSKEDSVKVLISGTGADELFGGYMRHFTPSIFTSKYLSEMPYAIRFPMSKFFSIFNRSFSERISDPLLNYFLAVSGMPSDLLFKIIRDPIRGLPFFSKYQKDFSKNYSLYFDQKFYLPDSLLAYTDKVSMANSVEIRVPYLCKSLSPILFLYLNESFKTKYSKPLLRKISSKYFNKEFFNRSKEGFDASVYSWPNEVISYLLNYIRDYSVQLNYIGIDIKPLINAKENFVRGYNRNLIFSLFILTKWLVNKNFIK